MAQLPNKQFWLDFRVNKESGHVDYSSIDHLWAPGEGIILAYRFNGPSFEDGRLLGIDESSAMETCIRRGDHTLFREIKKKARGQTIFYACARMNGSSEEDRKRVVDAMAQVATPHALCNPPGAFNHPGTDIVLQHEMVGFEGQVFTVDGVA